MLSYKLYLLCLVLVQFIIIVYAKKECIKKRIPNADTVCVCNATYCDDFPALKKPKDGFALVYESDKAGHRFKETQIKIDSKCETSNINTNQSQTITINSSIKYQNIEGFGGAFTDSTGQMLKQIPESLANSVIESYFSENGIEYTFGRIPIAGTDYSVRPYSYDDIEGDKNLTHFALQKEDLEWKIPYIKLAQKVSPHKLKLFGSPWSPPKWMKTNNKFNESGALFGNPGGEYYQIWANYFVKFLDSYKSHGIQIWGITVENEPIEGQNPKWAFNCLNLTVEGERDFVKLNLGPTLQKAGYAANELKLMIYDGNTPDMEEWANTILKDEEVAKYVSGIAFHWYFNRNNESLTTQILDSVHQKHPNMFLLNTEACHLEGAGHGVWQLGESYAFDIIRDLNNWVTGWVEWNMALDMDGGPRWNSNLKRGCGGPINIDPKAGEVYKQASFYMIGHFSKFIPPKSVRIEHKVDKEIDGLSVLTILRPDNATVVVALNANNEEIELNINDSKSHLSHKLSPHSIQSFIWW